MKNIMKKIVTLLLFVVVAFTVCSCKSDNVINAYDIAVENGFVGTEAEWLEALKGSDGKDGINGINGEDGKDASFTIEDLYQSAVDNGYEGDFFEFLKEYLNSNLSNSNSEQAINNALFSVVSIVAEYTVLEYQTLRSAYSSGSGVIYKLDKEAGDALIITNFHVIYNVVAYGNNKFAKNVNLFLYGQEYSNFAIPATILGGSMTYDIAILKVENSDIIKNSQATTATFADSNKIKVGSTAIAIGNPDGAGISATQGIVSVDSEYIDLYAADESTLLQFRSIRVDAAVNPGNSGGGLFNDKGELIGIVNAKTVSDDIENMGYAIPSTLAKAVAENVIWNATRGNSGVSKGLMGITVVVEESYAVYNQELQMAEIIEKVVIEEVSAGALAYGHLMADDVILSLEHNGNLTEITRNFFIVEYMLNVRPGDEVKVTVLRNGQEVTVTLTMKEENFTTLP